MFSATNNINNRSLFLSVWLGAILSLLTPSFAVALNHQDTGLQALTDSEMSAISGQALIVSNKIVGDGGSNGTAGLTFYNAGLDVELAMNANIKNLELGRTGPGATDVDLWAKNMMFGCTADASNNCVDSASATKLKDFILTRPYFQFAIENDNDATLREVVGIRLGAENAEGPLSIGEFKVFSGYLNATANLTMQGQQDIAVTCGPSTSPCRGGGNHSTGVNFKNYNEPFQSLGLDNERECILFVACVEFRQLTVRYNTVTRQNLPVVLNGSRKTQALIYNGRLSDAVDEIVNGMSVDDTSSFFGESLINLVLPIIRGNAASKIKQQLASGLGTTTANLNNYAIPYNASNLHRVDVNSPDFALSMQKRSVVYPGMVAAMEAGWSMYLPDAFTLNVSQPTTVFVSNIAQGNAAAGNIVGLDPVYDNCWGAANFC